MKDKTKTTIIWNNCAWTIYNFYMPIFRHLDKERCKVCLVTQFDGKEFGFAA